MRNKFWERYSCSCISRVFKNGTGDVVITYIKPLTTWFLREKDPDWDADIQDDVLEECTKYGYVYHIHVDKASNQVCATTFLKRAFKN